MKIVTYADDCTIYSSDPKITPACHRLNAYLAVLSDWLTDRRLVLSAEKSTASLFTCFNREFSTTLPITMAGAVIPTVNRPKLLGVVFDNSMTFCSHSDHVRKKVGARNNILKALSGTSWGQQKEVLLMTYKAMSQSVLSYAAPIWSPCLSHSRLDELQRAQNAALRCVTGCTLMSDPDHLHQETKVLPVRRHNDLLSKQFLLACHRDTHVNHPLVLRPPPSRHIKNSLSLEYDVTDLVPDRGLDLAAYRRGAVSLHTEAVRSAIGSYAPNKILGAPPPEVHKDERLLPRRTRTSLAQLRSGYCKLLNSYMSRIDGAVADRCPDCGGTPHTTNHLFNCPIKPTTLSVVSLWRDPAAAADFLGLSTDPFADDE